MTHRTKTLAIAATVGMTAALVGGGCGGGYAIEGRVVRGTMGMVQIVDADDPLLDRPGLAGANVRIVRDPGRLSREEVGGTTSDGNGNFTLRVDAFGAGVTNEEWLIIARRGGTSGAEGVMRLPSNPGRRRLLITLAAGQPTEEPARWSTSSDDLMRDYERFR